MSRSVASSWNVLNIAAMRLTKMVSIMFVAVVSNVYQLYLILTNRENTSCVDKYILRVASIVRCVAAQYRVHIMTSSFFKQNSVVNN